MHKIQRVQCREVRVEDDEYYEGSFGEEDDCDSIVGNRRYGGRLERLEIGKVITWVVLR